MVVHHHAEIRVRPVQPDGSLAPGQARGIDPGQYALCGGFLISGGAVDLAGEEQAGHGPQFQAPRQGSGIDVIVLHGITGADHAGVFEAGNGLQDGLLDVLGQAGGDAVGIDRGVVETFRFQEDIVSVLAAEPDDFVLDGRAVARAAPGDLAGIDGGFVEVFPDDRVGRLRRAGHPAFDLRVEQACGQGAEWLGFIVAGIGAQAFPINSTTVQPRRSPRLQAAERQTETR